MTEYEWANQGVLLRPPKQLGRVSAVIQLAASSLALGAYAALGICWPGGAKALPPSCRFEACQFSPGILAEAVFAELVSRGADLTEIMQNGLVCLGMLADRMNGVSGKEVSEAEDFSEQAQGS